MMNRLANEQGIRVAHASGELRGCFALPRSQRRFVAAPGSADFGGRLALFCSASMRAVLVSSAADVIIRAL
jgi:hypothetical protein